MLTIISPERGGPLRREPWVSISGKFNRITVFRVAYELMRSHHGRGFDFVKFAIDSSRPECFWMIPLDESDPECARIVFNQQNMTRTISSCYLLRSLGWAEERTIRCPVTWDAKNAAAKVVVNKKAK